MAIWQAGRCMENGQQHQSILTRKAQVTFDFSFSLDLEPVNFGLGNRQLSPQTLELLLDQQSLRCRSTPTSKLVSLSLPYPAYLSQRASLSTSAYSVSLALLLCLVELSPQRLLSSYLCHSSGGSGHTLRLAACFDDS
jgi:hypothetical protein